MKKVNWEHIFLAKSADAQTSQLLLKHTFLAKSAAAQTSQLLLKHTFLAKSAAAQTSQLLLKHTSLAKSAAAQTSQLPLKHTFLAKSAAAQTHLPGRVSCCSKFKHTFLVKSAGSWFSDARSSADTVPFLRSLSRISWTSTALYSLDTSSLPTIWTPPPLRAWGTSCCMILRSMHSSLDSSVKLMRPGQQIQCLQCYAFRLNWYLSLSWYLMTFVTDQG